MDYSNNTKRNYVNYLKHSDIVVNPPSLEDKVNEKIRKITENPNYTKD